MSVIRYELTIRLKTASPLHSGGIDEVVNRTEEGRDRQTVVRRFARDGRDRPILTGRSVKGALRAACRRYLSGQPDAGVAVTEETQKKVAEKAPVFGGNMGMELVCERWTANSAPNLKLTGKGAAPILVVGATGDSATPYQQAVTMAKQLESGHLLTYDGPGHGSVTSGNACVDETVTAYFEDGTLPEDGKTCS